MIGIRLRFTGFGGGIQAPRGEHSISLPSPTTVATLLDYLAGDPESHADGALILRIPPENLLIAVNGRLIQHQKGQQTPLASGDLVTIMPPVIGGSEAGDRVRPEARLL
jgi:molybdopterin converting factor small subunit